MRSMIRLLLRRLSLMESWVIFFILGIIMMNYPFISIFNKAVLVAGFPLLYIYLMGGWLVSILVIYLFVTANDGNNRGGHDSDKDDHP